MSALLLLTIICGLFFNLSVGVLPGACANCLKGADEGTVDAPGDCTPSFEFSKGKCGLAIIGQTKTDRPAVTEYFTAKKIKAHVDQYSSDAAAYLIPYAKLKQYTVDPYAAAVLKKQTVPETELPTTIGLPTAQFLTTKTALTGLIKKAATADTPFMLSCDLPAIFADKQKKQKATEQFRVVETGLGITPAWLASVNLGSESITDTNIIMVVLPGDKITATQNLRMPAGNEQNANDAWIAGGFLPGGYSDLKIPEVVGDKIPLADVECYKVFSVCAGFVNVDSAEAMNGAKFDCKTGLGSSITTAHMAYNNQVRRQRKYFTRQQRQKRHRSRRRKYNKYYY